MEAESREDFGEKEFGNSFGGDGFVARSENYPLRKPMVYHDHNRVITLRFGEIGNQIYGKLREGAKGGGGYRVHRRCRRVSLRLHLLASRTAINIVPDKGTHTGPPIVTFDINQSGKTSGMPSSQMIMGEIKDSLSEVRGNVGTFLIVQCVIDNLPIGECGAHGRS